jgi:WD40 repeat protein
VKFVPFAGNMDIVTSGSSGEIHLVKLPSSEVVNQSRIIAKHTSRVVGLGFYSNEPCSILSAGRDGNLIEIDLRSKQSTTFLDVLKFSTILFSLYYFIILFSSFLLFILILLVLNLNSFMLTLKNLYFIIVFFLNHIMFYFSLEDSTCVFVV